MRNVRVSAEARNANENRDGRGHRVETAEGTQCGADERLDAVLRGEQLEQRLHQLALVLERVHPIRRRLHIEHAEQLVKIRKAEFSRVSSQSRSEANANILPVRVNTGVRSRVRLSHRHHRSRDQ